MPARHRGFTLIELMVVAIILGIIGAVVIPQFVDATVSDTKDKAREANLKSLQTAIDLYVVQHDGVYPAARGSGTADSNTETAFIDQLTKYTNGAGQASATRTDSYPLGPYLRAIPVEPVTGDASVLVSSDGAPTRRVLSAETGWYYVVSTGKIVANKDKVIEVNLMMN